MGFSLNPLNNCYDQVVINASFGLGEAIKKINDKKVAIHLKANGGIEERENPNPKQQAFGHCGN